MAVDPSPPDSVPTPVPARRLHALDALRGILACVVVAHHALKLAGSKVTLEFAAEVAVLSFFVMSGYVLALSYDGRPLAFMVRRVVRLWPVYAVCIVAGYAVFARLPPLLDLIWWPVPAFGRETFVDGPAWTLYCEIWAAPLLPAMFRLARGRASALAMTLAFCTLAFVDARLFPLGFFCMGVAATKFAVRLPQTAPGWTLWLGRISYSLYLSHWVVMNAALHAIGPAGPVLAVPVVFPVAWLLWRTVERPSIRWSRLVVARMVAVPP